MVEEPGQPRSPPRGCLPVYKTPLSLLSPLSLSIPLSLSLSLSLSSPSASNLSLSKVFTLPPGVERKEKVCVGKEEEEEEGGGDKEESSDRRRRWRRRGGVERKMEGGKGQL